MKFTETAGGGYIIGIILAVYGGLKKGLYHFITGTADAIEFVDTGSATGQQKCSEANPDDSI